MENNVLDMYEHVAMDNSGITINELDDKVMEMVEAREAYEAKKKESTDLYKLHEQSKYELLQMLTTCGKEKYLVDGLGTVSKVLKKSSKVPKDVESKGLMLAYFKSLGEQEYLNFVSIHSATLNSYINEQLAVDPDFKLPGITEQKITEELRFTKARSKK